MAKFIEVKTPDGKAAINVEHIKYTYTNVDGKTCLMLTGDDYIVIEDGFEKTLFAILAAKIKSK